MSPVRAGSSRQSLRRAYGSRQKVTRFAHGPFIGMRDSVDPTAGRDGFAKLLKNAYSVDPQFGSAVVHRPGYRPIESSDAGAWTQGPAQLFHQFTKLDGTTYSLAVEFGQVLRYAWGDANWSIPAGGVLIGSRSRSGKWYAVTFNDKVVFSDGHTSPFTWDGTDGAGYASLASVIPGALYGQPVVHYGKLFGIKADERSALIWSNENDPASGYEAGGFNNAWTLLQTDTDPLERLLPTNEGLIVFRRRSITVIYGEVTENFSSTGTREAISSEEGTASPASVFFGGEGDLIFFANADGQPHYMEIGGRPIPIWEDARETLLTLDPGRFDEIEGFWDPVREHAVFCYSRKGEERRSVQLRYHVKGGRPRFACVWDGYDISRIGVLEDAGGAPVIVHGETTLDGSTYTVFAHEDGDPSRPPLADDQHVSDSYEATPDLSLQMSPTAGNTSGYAEAFTAIRAGKLMRVSWHLLGGLSAAGSSVAKLYALSGTYATDAVPGAVLATSDPVDLATLSVVGVQPVSFNFPAGQNYQLVAGGEYMISVEFVTSNVVTYVAAVLAGSGVHTGNVAERTDGVWSDFGIAGCRIPFAVTVGESVARHVRTHPKPYSEHAELHFDRLDVQVRSRREVQALYAQIATAHGLSDAALVGFEDGVSLWDDATWDSSHWDYGEASRHGVLGIDAWGSGAGVWLSQEGLGLPFSLLSLSLRGRVMGEEVAAR